MSTETRKFGRRVVSRLAVGAMAGTLALAAMALPAAATADHDAARLGSEWLAERLPEGGAYQNPMGGALPDYGLTIDALLAMHATGHGDHAKPIVDLLDSQAKAHEFFTLAGLLPDGGEDYVTAGATAKVLVAALVSGADARNFGGWDMVQETLDTIVTEDIEPQGHVAGFEGRIRDYHRDPGMSLHNSANVFGQSLAVIGLAGADESFAAGTPAAKATEALVRQQCSEGYFRIFYSQEPYSDPDNPSVSARTQSCDEGKANGASAPDGDATGLGLSALLTAQRAGAEGLDGPIAATVAWLEDNQDPGGGWGGGVSTEAPNTNSTGLIVQALADAGGDADVISDGVDYLRGAQITAADADCCGLGEYVGAVAYNHGDYQSARSNGAVTGIDTWKRSTSQAVLGLAQVSFGDLVHGTVPVPEPVEPTMSVSADQAHPGDELSLSAAGFAPSEEVTLTLHSEPVLLATLSADSGGALQHTFTLPEVAAGIHTLELVGLESATTVSAPLEVLAPAEDSGTSGDSPAEQPAAGEPGTSVGEDPAGEPRAGHPAEQVPTPMAAGTTAGGEPDHGSLLPRTGAALGLLGLLAVSLAAGGELLRRASRYSHNSGER